MNNLVCPQNAMIDNNGNMKWTQMDKICKAPEKGYISVSAHIIRREKTQRKQKIEVKTPRHLLVNNKKHYH